MRYGVTVLFFLANLHLAAADGPPILLNVGPIDADRETAASARSLASKTFSGKRLHLVQFDGPIQPEWVAGLESSGLRIVSYIPNNAYLVYGDATAHAAMRSRAKNIRWEGAFLDDDKIQPRAKVFDAKGNARVPRTDLFAVQLFSDPAANAATLALIDSIKLAPIQKTSQVEDYINVVVRLPPDQVGVLAGQPDVVSINIYVTPTKFDERQDIIVSGQLTGNGPSAPGYLNWLASKGFTQSQFTASGFVVDVTDSGLDNGTTNINHFGLFTFGNTNQLARAAYCRLEGSPNAGSTIQGCDGHGNLNAHIIGGYVTLTNFPHTDSAGYRHGLGVCPFVKVGSSVIFDPGNFTSPDYEDLISRAYRDGARISSDSWGADTAGGYDVDAQAYDFLVRDAQPSASAVPVAGNQGMTIVFAAGNAGSGAGTVGSPGTAKNIITVGAAENVHSHAQTNGGNNASGNDGCSTPDAEANSANDIASFSSRGPCDDGRHKPEIVAPGTHVTGGVGQQVKTMQGNGNDIACFEGTGVCALPGGGTVGSTNNFFPQGQQFYSTSSGTSHSTPAVAGGCALVYQWFINNGLNAPSPAMIKAVLMNAARYMNGVDANDNLWSDDQGMGMMDLGRAFDGTQRFLRDQVTNDIFTASGQSRSFTAQVASNSKPVRVTLSWTDKPGSTVAASTYNNLNLTVVAGGKTYLGNVFNGATSTNGGSADAVNNSESVFLPAGTTGIVSVTVNAFNIAGDGVPNFGGSLDQDFALVIYNGVEIFAPSIAAAGSQLTAESCGIGNGFVDPDEVVTVRLALSNVGSAPTTNVVATLQSTGGVTAPSGAQSYGALAASGPAVTNDFTFTATGACGGVVSATLDLVDGTNSLGSVSYTFSIGGTSTGAPQTNNNASSITIVDNANASPYPSTINVAGMAGTISKVTCSLFGFSHTFPSDVDVLLVSPSGQSVALMGAVGGGTDASGANLTFDDAAAGQIGATVVSGTFKPTGSIASMPSPAPGGPFGSLMADFNGASPNGTWSLYVVDAEAVDSGNISGGWRLVITAGEPSCCASNQPPVLAPIGNKLVVQSNTLAFAVTATDPADGDPITLSVSNAPINAAFVSTNGNGTFSWTNTVIVGVYTSTFYASDIDGADAETIQITVLDGSCVGSNVISENFVATTVPAGWSNTLTANDAVATHYQSAPNCRAFTTGDALITPAVDFPTQIVFYVDSSGGGNGETASIEYSIGGGAFSALGSFVVSTTGSNRTFVVNASPNLSTSEDVRFRFNSSFNTWYLDDVRISGGCAATGGAQTPPVLNPIGPKSVSASNTLQFAVTAAPSDGDTVTLTASNLPAGAAFSATNENGTFAWTSAAPVGVYTSSFFASDNDGVDSEAVVITVNEQIQSSTNPILTYIFEDAVLVFTRAATNVLPGMTASLFDSGDGSTINAPGNPDEAIEDDGFIGSTGNWFQFTMTVDDGSTASVARIGFHDQRANTGPGTWIVRSSLDNFAADLASGGTHLSFETNEASLSIGSVTGAVTFRIIGENGQAGGTWRLDNVSLYGGGPTPGEPLPNLSITTATQSVSNPTTTIPVGGTANTNVIGQISWTNNLTGGFGTIPAATSWLIGSVPLNVGANVITVRGTNGLGDAASANVTITRQSAGGGGGCSNILFQGFEPGDNWLIATGTVQIVSTNGPADTPAGQRIRSGTNSWQAIGSGNRTLILASASIGGYTGRQVSVRVSATSLTAGNGVENGDFVRLFVALNGAAFSTTPDIYLNGGPGSTNNCRWGFWATNILVTTAGTLLSNVPPQSAISTNNYANLFINIPDSATSIALRATTLADANEVWNLDDIALFGCSVGGAPDTTPSLIIGTSPQTVEFGVTNIPVSGTSSNLVGEILWTNGLSGGAGSIPASDNWTITDIALAVGTNNITVSGSNGVSVVTNAGILIIRESSDVDGDGIDDAWEQEFFTNLTSAAENTDSDGDGFLDLHEFYAGSLPNDGDSLLEETATAITDAQGFLVTWQSHTGRFYLVARSTNLLENFTGIATNIAATPPLNVYTDTTAEAIQHYRIEGKNGPF